MCHQIIQVSLTVFDIFSGLLCLFAILLVIGTTYDVLVLKLKFICKNRFQDIAPLQYVKTEIDLSGGERECHKNIDNTATTHVTKEVERLLERNTEEDRKTDMIHNSNTTTNSHTGQYSHLSKLIQE